MRADKEIRDLSNGAGRLVLTYNHRIMMAGNVAGRSKKSEMGSHGHRLGCVVKKLEEMLEELIEPCKTIAGIYVIHLMARALPGDPLVRTAIFVVDLAVVDLADLKALTVQHDMSLASWARDHVPGYKLINRALEENDPDGMNPMIFAFLLAFFVPVDKSRIKDSIQDAIKSVDATFLFPTLVKTNPNPSDDYFDTDKDIKDFLSRFGLERGRP